MDKTRPKQVCHNWTEEAEEIKTDGNNKYRKTSYWNSNILKVKKTNTLPFVF